MERRDLFSNLKIFFDLFQNYGLNEVLVREFLEAIGKIDASGITPGRIDFMQSVYEMAFRYIEKEAADKGFREDLLILQRDLYLELETIFSFQLHDPRHHFLIVVPVADRPLMLKNCINSLRGYLRLFKYGGTRRNHEGSPFYNKVSLFVIDDSKDESNILRIKTIADETRTAGIRTYYIGLDEQADVLGQIPSGYRERLSSLIGEFSEPASPHKGASITRNIAYLYLLSVLDKLEGRKLIYFLDSDEEFKIKIRDGQEARDTPFINYFYWLDRIFTSSGAEVLTGKVVGDPPVSPAVMINTFLDDLIVSLEALSEAGMNDECEFHEPQAPEAFSAEYHDMVKLFGYKGATAPKKYPCGLSGSHTVKDCFEDLSNRALGFFYGLHPTRTQLYIHTDDFLKTEEARTVYTGNYIFNENGFRHFIPFAGLKLRMAGPALGRILRQRLKHRFVSANLPLLHKRTSGAEFKNEFRSGIREGKEMIDLSGEYNSQFWGDVMLFTVDSLTALGYPDRCVKISVIMDTVMDVQKNIFELYTEQQYAVVKKIMKIRAILSDAGRWWNIHDKDGAAINNFGLFCSSVENNFGDNSAALKKISEQITEGLYTGMIINGIDSFYEDDFLWNELLRTECFAASLYEKVSTSRDKS